MILRYLLADHAEYFPKACAVLDSVKTGDTQAYIPEGVIVEGVYVLLKVYGVPRAEVAAKLSGLLRYAGVINENLTILVDALRLFNEKNVDIVDAIVQATANAREWTPCSFDQDMKKLQR